MASPTQGGTTHTTLDDHDYGFLYDQLSTCAHKWEAITTGLRFKGDEIQKIKRDPLNVSGGHESCLGVLLTNWLQWTPGDARGSKNRATLQALKNAVSKAGFGVIAKNLTASEPLQEELERGQNAHSEPNANEDDSDLSDELESGSSMPSLDPDTEMDLEQLLNRNLKAIQKKYASYVDCVRSIIQKIGVSASELSAFLLSLPASASTTDKQKLKRLSDMEQDLEEVDTVAKVFFKLTSKYSVQLRPGIKVHESA